MAASLTTDVGEADENHRPIAHGAALEGHSYAGLMAEKASLREEMTQINPDELSPRKALEVLYRLKKL